MGGMGNQMYAYALGKALSLKKQQALLIDKSWMNELGKERGLNLFTLDNFEIPIDEWKFSSLPIIKWFFYRKADRFFSFLSKFGKNSRKKVLCEKTCCFDDWILQIKSKSIYIRGGTWQSFKYFAEYENEIKQAFEFKPNVYVENKAWADIINGDNKSVSVHIRRGDYVNNPDCGYTQNICTRAYYDIAMNLCKEKLGNPQFYFFSDDIEFVKQEFGNAENYTFVERPASTKQETGFRDDGYKDMFLMTLCQHNIIANSTFSWWAAFLNKNPNKLVIAPNRWYNGIIDDSFIVRPEWIRVGV